MVILGILLIGLGALAIVAAVFTGDGSAQLLGLDLTTLEIFLVGLGAGAAILWGLMILKYGTKRELRQRRERRRLTELSQQLDQVDTERRAEDEGD